MIRSLYILILTVFLAACAESIPRIEEPNNLIAKEKMVAVMKDLVLLESHIQTEFVSITKFHKAMVNSGDALLKEHEISFDQFEASLEYYGSRQEEMVEIYSEALELLNKELGELQTENE